MNIGEPLRTYTIEPIEDPVPREAPATRPEKDPDPEPARREPEPVPAE
jgi:hypothetical protein